MLVHWVVPALFALLALAWGLALKSSPPSDDKRLREHFQMRGRRVLSIRRVGTDLHWAGLKQNLPIRKYELTTVGPSGELTTQVIGVDSGFLGDQSLWLYNQEGGRREMF